MSKSHNIDKKIQRQLAIEAGFYDGRFKTKVVEDKKKKASKEACKNIKVNLDNENG